MPPTPWSRANPPNEQREEPVRTTGARTEPNKSQHAAGQIRDQLPQRERRSDADSRTASTPGGAAERADASPSEAEIRGQEEVYGRHVVTPRNMAIANQSTEDTITPETAIAAARARVEANADARVNTLRPAASPNETSPKPQTRQVRRGRSM